MESSASAESSVPSTVSPASLQNAKDDVQLAVFHVGGEEFGIEILHVQEIIRVPQLTYVPNAPSFINGVTNLRGKIIPVIELRKRFDLEPALPDKQTRVIVLEINGIVVGFMVDSVSEVLRVPGVSIEQPPRLRGVKQEYVSGVARFNDRLLILLDLDRLMKDAERPVSTVISQGDS